MKTLAMVLALAGLAFPQQSSSNAFDELVRQAEGGSADAQVNLGLAYEEGKGVQQSDELALEWYRKAAEQGSAKAQNNIGTMYSMGQGVAQDKSEAFRWYKKAALQGLAAADYNIAISWFNGDGTSVDPVRAYAWMMLAKRNGAPKAPEALDRIAQEVTIRTNVSERMLAELFESGKEVPRDWKSAFDLYRKLANEDSKVALYGQSAIFLKLCIIQGVDKPDIPHDYAAAKSWCDKAARQGVAEGDVILGRMAEQGLGGPRDPERSCEPVSGGRHPRIVRWPDGTGAAEIAKRFAFGRGRSLLLVLSGKADRYQRRRGAGRSDGAASE
jgi:hypothetical protein